MIRHVFFDAAGTLFELAAPVGETYACIAAQHGVTRETDELEKRFRAAWRSHPAPEHPPGRPPEDDDRSWWKALVRSTFEDQHEPLSEAQLAALFDDLYEHFAQATAWRLFPETVDVLKALSPHFHLHVLSNFDTRLLRILDGLGIASRFKSINLSSRVGASKPHPRIFAHALHLAAATDPAECLHVGDEKRADLEGATRSGLHAWLVERPEKSLWDVAKNLLAHDYSTLHPPAK